jgi:hypothetical protein
MGEMGCLSFLQPMSLGFSDGHRKPILELVGIVVEAPRLRGLDEIGSASPGGHRFKSSGNRVTPLEHARMTKTLNALKGYMRCIKRLK